VKKLRRSRASLAVAALGAAVLTVGTTGPASSEEAAAAAEGDGVYLAPYYTQGDLTGDDAITKDDVDLLVAALGTDETDAGWAAVEAADYDADGEISMTDVADLAQRVIYDDGPFDLVEATAVEMQAAMNAGVVTSVELTQDYLDRIAAYDAKTFEATGTRALNSIVVTGGEDALAAAAASDAYRAEHGGPRSMLDGLPILLKDNYDTEDMPTSAGTGGWKNNQTSDDAFMVKGLRAAGAVILGKASLDEFALGFSSQFSTNSPAGSALSIASPYNLSQTAGGSSGGTGASIAANLGAIGFGTDTGGSIRVPSSYNQLVGIRPTVGLASRDGIVPLALSQDTGGPIARSVSDAAIALDAVTGVDPNDDITEEQVGHVPASYTSYLDPTALEGKRIGYVTSMVPGTNTANNAATKRLFDQAVLDLQAQGATIVPITTSALTATLNEPSGSTNEFKHDLTAYVDQHLDPTVEQRDLAALLAGGQMVPGRSSTYTSRNNITEQQYQTWMGTHLAAIATGEAAVNTLFAENSLDALVYPSGVPYGTFSTNMRLSPNTGMPSISVPMGQTVAADSVGAGAGAGVNLELLGPSYSEGMLIGFAYDYEQATHHRTTPSLFPALEGER
jgi:amidase